MTKVIRRGGWILGAAALAVPLLTANTYYLYVGMLIGVNVVLAAGLNVLAGWSGQVSLGHAGLYAIGAYVGAILATRAGFGLWASLPVAVLVCAAVGALLAAPALRVSGPYLAMMTIAFGIIVEHGLIEWDTLTQGFGGIANIPKPMLLGWTLTLPRYYYVVLAMAALGVWMTRNLAASPWGRALVAVREDEIAAESLGLNSLTLKTTAFVLSAAYAGAAGCLFAFLTNFVSPDSFTLQTSILFLLIVIFGGLGQVMGPVVGAVVLIVLPELLHRFADYRLILYGCLLLASIYFLPRGVVGALARSAAPLPRPGDRTGGAVALRPARGPVALEARGLRMRFGGLVAVNDVDLAVPPATVHAVIGPNGAGKTTVLNLLTGFYRPSEGQIRLGERRLDGLPSYRIAREGIARTFQTTRLFQEATVLDNVLVGLAGPRLGPLAAALVRGRGTMAHGARMCREARALLRFVGYAGPVEELARNLAFGHRRIVEIARALATRPSLLLLDEPAAGLTQAEIAALDRLIGRIREAGIAVLLVEHHMELVMEASSRVTVLDYGRRIAEGPPADVQRDPAVLEAYLGQPPGGSVHAS